MRREISEPAARGGASSPTPCVFPTLRRRCFPRPSARIGLINTDPVHDLHAPILHLLGLDHEELIYRYSGHDFRLTDVHGKVIHDIIA